MSGLGQFPKKVSRTKVKVSTNVFCLVCRKPVPVRAAEHGDQFCSRECAEYWYSRMQRMQVGCP